MRYHYIKEHQQLVWFITFEMKWQMKKGGEDWITRELCSKKIKTWYQFNWLIWKFSVRYKRGRATGLITWLLVVLIKKNIFDLLNKNKRWYWHRNFTTKRWRSYRGKLMSLFMLYSFMNCHFLLRLNISKPD